MLKQHLSDDLPVVLIVDDDPMLRLLLRETVTPIGLVVKEAENGAEALKLFEQWSPELVLMDIKMPVMNGLDACAKMRQLPNGKDVPIVLITAMDDEAAITQAFNIDATDFVTKPVNWQILNHRARYLLKAGENLRALRRSKSCLSHAQKIAAMGNWEWDIVNDKLSWSDQVYRIFGFQAQSFEITYEVFINTVHPEDRGNIVQAINSALDGSKVYSIDHRIVLADGSERILHEQAEVVLSEAGEPIFMQGMVQDITERKLAEQELAQSKEFLESLVNGIADPIFVKDDEHRFILLNNALCQMLDFSRAEMLGKTDYDFFPKEASDISWQQDEQVLLSDELNINEGEIDTSNGLLTISTIKKSFTNPTTGKRNLVGTVRDISIQKKTEQALLNTQKMEAIGHLTGGIAHDFNNILAIILGHLHLLELQVKDNKEVSKRIGIIRKAAQRASDLTKQLLGFSRHQARQLAITDINEVIRNMDSLIARSVTPEVEVACHYAKDLWLTKIDPGDFQDALFNLILNARDAMAGSGKLTLETSNCVLDADYCALNPGSSSGKFVQLSITDSGIGIAAEQQPHIFEPFFTTKPQGKGTGLGLAMVFGFINRSGGHINFCSKPGAGTTFHLYLPQTQEDGQQVSNKFDRPEVLPRGKETILIVDDEADLLELVKESLGGLGYTVLMAFNGTQALAQLAKYPDIDLLFSDVLMPGGMNGYELAERATDNHPGLKVLLTSGYTDKAKIHNGQASFSSNLLHKPYKQTELAKRVRVVLD